MSTARALDPEIQEVVSILNQRGIETFSSCSGNEGHDFSYPMVRCKPCDPVRLFEVLAQHGYDGFYVKEYYSSHIGPRVEFIEVQFWSLDCLNRGENGQRRIKV